MSLAKLLRSKPIARMENGVECFAPREDLVAVEEPLELRLAGRSIAVVMRTPGHDRELAAGFLVTEGLIRHRDEILDLLYCDPRSPAAGEARGVAAVVRENVLDVIVAPGVQVDFQRLTRNVFTSSSCGICSKASIEAVRAQFPPVPATRAIRASVLATLPAKLTEAQVGFAATGGLHASALFDVDGSLLVAREDVGRHNALDKVIGHAFFAGRLPLSQTLLLVSGRVSFEIMQKALAAGIPCVAAISAPTSAAVELAAESGQTLVGFLRDARMNVYTGTLAD